MSVDWHYVLFVGGLLAMGILGLVLTAQPTKPRSSTKSKTKPDKDEPFDDE